MDYTKGGSEALPFGHQQGTYSVDDIY